MLLRHQRERGEHVYNPLILSNLFRLQEQRGDKGKGRKGRCGEGIRVGEEREVWRGGTGMGVRGLRRRDECGRGEGGMGV